MNDLKRILRKRIEGQIKTFVVAHPDILLGVTWQKQKPRDRTLIDGLTKRILNDLMCEDSLVQIRSALETVPSAEQESQEIVSPG